jgi:hypothetical protein
VLSLLKNRGDSEPVSAILKFHATTPGGGNSGTVSFNQSVSSDGLIH